MPKYQLYYFDVRGRAEVTRLMFHAKGVEFEDIRFSREEWGQNYKKDMPFGQAPVLAVDGKKSGQSIAIFNYVARVLGLYGKTPEDQLIIDQIVQLQSDCSTAGSKFFRETDEKKKAQLKDEFCEVEVPKYMGHLVDLLKANKTGYFVGSSLTLADILVYEWVNSMETTEMLSFIPQKLGPLTAKYPELKQVCDNVLSNPGIKTYVESRKATMI